MIALETTAPRPRWRTRRATPRDPVTVSIGLGRNSVGLLVGLWERGEAVDAILFALSGCATKRRLVVNQKGRKG